MPLFWNDGGGYAGSGNTGRTGPNATQGRGYVGGGPVVRNYPGSRWGSPDLAAINALDYINPTSVQTNKEYGGLILYDPSNQSYYATTPTYNRPNGQNAKTVTEGDPGWYHTHGAQNGVNDSYSVTDIFNADNIANAFGSQVSTYLGTPSGQAYRYDGQPGVWNATGRSRNAYTGPGVISIGPISN